MNAIRKSAKSRKLRKVISEMSMAGIMYGAPIAKKPDVELATRGSNYLTKEVLCNINTIYQTVNDPKKNRKARPLLKLKVLKKTKKTAKEDEYSSARAVLKVRNFKGKKPCQSVKPKFLSKKDSATSTATKDKYSKSKSVIPLVECIDEGKLIRKQKETIRYSSDDDVSNQESKNKKKRIIAESYSGIINIQLAQNAQKTKTSKKDLEVLYERGMRRNSKTATTSPGKGQFSLENIRLKNIKKLRCLSEAGNESAEDDVLMDKCKKGPPIRKFPKDI